MSHPAGRLVHAEVTGDVGQQPGDDELGEADPEAAQGEGEQPGGQSSGEPARRGGLFFGRR